jgi:hypothetical protein
MNEIETIDGRISDQQAIIKKVSSDMKGHTNVEQILWRTATVRKMATSKEMRRDGRFD